MAYAAIESGNAALKTDAAQCFFSPAPKGWEPVLATKPVESPTVLNPVEEANWVSTNLSAQWGLAAMQVSALIPDLISKEGAGE
jgi:hypothetical protein